MSFVLGFFSYIALLIALPLFFVHPKLQLGLAERFGFTGSKPKPQLDSPRIWMHGASAGDILALLPTAKKLVAQLGPNHVVATTMTNSGFAMAQQWRSIFAEVMFCPVDVPFAVGRALDRIKPDILVLEYAELWPNLIVAAQARRIPVVLHNGRLSALKRRSYRLLFLLSGNLLRAMSCLLMRDESEAEQALLLGAEKQRVMVSGNTKFDSLADEVDAGRIESLRRALSLGPEDLLWVAGSTHEGEEESLFRIYKQLKKNHATLKLLVAPRYAERAERLVHLLEKMQLTQTRRSQNRPKPSQEVAAQGVDVFILDTIGELQAAYSLAHVVFVGGSFVPRGGQNILEPAACARAVLFGPHMHNFKDSVRVLLGRGGLQAQTWQQLERLVDALLERPEECRALGKLAQAQVLAVRGAAERNAKEILRLVRSFAPTAD